MYIYCISKDAENLNQNVFTETNVMMKTRYLYAQKNFGHIMLYPLASVPWSITQVPFGLQCSNFIR
jgi:hypothetical protein